VDSSRFAPLLLPTEQLLYVTGPHWIMLVPSLILLVTSRLAAQEGNPRTAGLFLVLGLGFLLLAAYRYCRTTIGLTDHRVIAWRFTWQGWRSSEISLRTIDRLEVYRAFGFSYGTVRICSTGRALLCVQNLRAPERFREKVQTQLGVVRGYEKPPGLGLCHGSEGMEEGSQTATAR
jgi:hypothetical protein